MATVLSHIHFCPRCNNTWKGVSWVCEQEDGELICQPCRVQYPEGTKKKKTLAPSETWQNDREHMRERDDAGCSVTTWSSLVSPYGAPTLPGILRFSPSLTTARNPSSPPIETLRVMSLSFGMRH